MQKFEYKAKEGPSKVVSGIIEADNIDSAIKNIVQKGLTPIDVIEYKSKTSYTNHNDSFFAFFPRKRIPSSEIVDFTRQISDMVEASVPILRVLQVIFNQTKNIAMKRVIESLYEKVQDGISFSEALTAHPKVFSPIYISMIRTGEISGNMDKVLDRLAEHLEKDQETKAKVQSSLAYPGLILIVGVITVFVMLTFVVPNIVIMFDDLDQSLPLPTIIMMNISSIFSRFWILLLGVLSLAWFYFRKWLLTDTGKKKMDKFKLQIPLLSDFVRIAEAGSFCRTLGTLVSSGINITTALKAVCTTINNSILKEEIIFASDEIANGLSLKNALGKCSLFPESSLNMIAVGEETGNLDKSLYKIADMFEKKTDQTVKTMISLLGPAVLIVVVSLVGFIVVSMLLPIFQMNLLVQ